MTNTVAVLFLALLVTQRPSVPLEKEIAMGRQKAAELEPHTRLVSDPDRVRESGGPEPRLEFKLQLSFHNQDGKFGRGERPVHAGWFRVLNTGVIVAADSEAELAAVIAHQIAYMTARHGAEGLTYTQAPTVQVREADTLGAQYLYKTGYDPRAAFRFLQKVQGGMERIDALQRTSKQKDLRPRKLRKMGCPLQRTPGEVRLDYQSASPGSRRFP